MAIYAISDLHLSFSSEKPMDVFGSNWKDHVSKIEENWIKQVKDDDIVVLPGDISWAMALEDFLLDIRFLEELPGRKLISKGNHDYWWQTAKKLKEFKCNNNINTITFIHNNSYKYKDEEKEYLICATRGWKCPGDKDFTENDLKVYNREIQRLELSILSGKTEDNEVIAFLHYPPFNNKRERTGFTEILEKYKVKNCYYGHLHGEMAHQNALVGKLNENDYTSYQLVSCDYLDFRLFKVL